MSKSLGIFVTNPDQFKHILGITKAATAKGSSVKVFLTWDATLNAKKEADFPELCKLADVSLCVDSYKNMGYDVEDIPEGLEASKMGTQAQHGIIIEDFDCYLSLQEKASMEYNKVCLMYRSKACTIDGIRSALGLAVENMYAYGCVLDESEMDKFTELQSESLEMLRDMEGDVLSTKASNCELNDLEPITIEELGEKLRDMTHIIPYGIIKAQEKLKL